MHHKTKMKNDHNDLNIKLMFDLKCDLISPLIKIFNNKKFAKFKLTTKNY